MRSVCVFTGSNHGARTGFAEAARALGAELVRRDITLVFGAGSVGLMGVVADAVLDAGGRAIGVIPDALFPKEVAHEGLTELHVTASMHERKARMAELAGGFVALPGGLGTLEELFEVLTWSQLGIHAMPVGMLNVLGYFDSLLEFLERAVAERFVSEAHRNLLLTDENPARLLDRMEIWRPPSGPKWLDLESA
jgi:hypothetical protein